MRTKGLCLALLIAGSELLGCSEACSGSCSTATPSVTQRAAVVKVVADPPCMASVAQVDGRVQITVTLQFTVTQQPSPPSGDLSCQVYEWLSDGTELTAQASFKLSSGYCCDHIYTIGTLSEFSPVDGGAPDVAGG